MTRRKSHDIAEKEKFVLPPKHTIADVKFKRIDETKFQNQITTEF